MTNDSDDDALFRAEMRDLRKLVGRALLRQMKAEDPSASVLNVARQFLNDYVEDDGAASAQAKHEKALEDLYRNMPFELQQDDPPREVPFDPGRHDNNP